MEYTNEQKLIATMLSKNNIIVDAVAGSGKTTTIKHVVESFPDVNINVILYSKLLTVETSSRIKNKNVDIRTIHSFCQYGYKQKCNDDTGLKYIIKDDTKYTGKNYNLLIIDEAQDLTPLLARIIIKIIKDCDVKKLLFLGDVRQCIYKFKQADERFLFLANEIFTDAPQNWERLKLSESFRCTKQIARFVNKCLLKEERIISHKSGQIGRAHV